MKLPPPGWNAESLPAGGVIVRQIVDRCHVGDRYVAVLRYLRSRLKPGAWSRLTRAQRRELIRDVLNTHAANRRLYRVVMGGR